MNYNKTYITIRIFLTIIVSFSLYCKNDSDYKQTNNCNVSLKIYADSKSSNISPDHKNYHYFKSMKNKIAKNWSLTEVNKYVSPNANSKIKYIKIPLPSHVKLFFIINRTGDVIEVNIIESEGYLSLDESCIKAIKKSKNFGSVPDNIKGNKIVIPFEFVLNK